MHSRAVKEYIKLRLLQRASLVVVDLDEAESTNSLEFESIPSSVFKTMPVVEPDRAASIDGQKSVAADSPPSWFGIPAPSQRNLHSKRGLFFRGSCRISQRPTPHITSQARCSLH